MHDATKSLPEYWSHSDGYYNFARNVRGLQHVLATVDEKTYTGGTMGADHPVSWCQDLDGGRSFYIAAGHTASSFSDSNLERHLEGAIKWAAGRSDPVYSDCGATVLANYKQVKISAPPNLNEPIGFDQLPDGRVIQTARAGQVRLHDLAGGTTTTLATIPVYTNSEDGLYGPAVDNNFATNKWVYLYYAPPTVTNVPQSDGSIAPSITTNPTATAPTTAASPTAWDPFVGYFQLSRFKFVEAAPGNPAHLDLASEQKILRVSNNRGACCHVGGDIDFDQHEQPLARHRRRHAVRRRQLRRLLAAQRPEDGRVPDRQGQQRHGRHVHADVRRPDDRSDRVQRHRRGARGGARGPEQRRAGRRVRQLRRQPVHRPDARTRRR